VSHLGVKNLQVQNCLFDLNSGITVHETMVVFKLLYSTTTDNNTDSILHLASCSFRPQIFDFDQGIITNTSVWFSNLNVSNDILIKTQNIRKSSNVSKLANIEMQFYAFDVMLSI
jgi:hypothetical protein